MVTEYVQFARQAVEEARGGCELFSGNDWAKREIEQAKRLIDRAARLALGQKCCGVSYRLARLAYHHAARAKCYVQLASRAKKSTADDLGEVWAEAEVKAWKADGEFLKRFPENPAPKQWNDQLAFERWLYDQYEFVLDQGALTDYSVWEESLSLEEEPEVDVPEEVEDRADPADYWKPQGWRLDNPLDDA